MSKFYIYKDKKYTNEKQLRRAVWDITRTALPELRTNQDFERFEITVEEDKQPSSNITSNHGYDVLFDQSRLIESGGFKVYSNLTEFMMLCCLREVLNNADYPHKGIEYVDAEGNLVILDKRAINTLISDIIKDIMPIYVANLTRLVQRGSHDE